MTLLLILVLGQAEPTTLDGWLARARERSVNGFAADSIAAWTKAIEINRDRAESYVGRARARRQGNDSAGALEDLEKALQLSPSCARAYVERGITWERRGNPSNARDDYEKALGLEPENTAALYQRGMLKRRQNKHQEAEEDLKKAAEASSEDPGVLLWRAYAKMSLGNLVAQEDKGDGPDAAVQGMLTGATFEWVQGALEDFTAVLEKEPDNGTLFAERASVYTSLGKWPDAEKDLRRSIELAPRQAKTQFELGRLLEYQGRRKESLACFEKAVELDPKYGAAYFGRANARHSQGDAKGAIADLNKVLQLNGKWTSAYFNRGMCKSDLKDWQGALADFTKVVELDDGKLVMAAICNRGWCRKSLGDEPGSRKEYAKAAGMPAETPWQLRYRSGAKETVGDLKGAIADMQAAVEKAPAGSSERSEAERQLERLKKK